MSKWQKTCILLAVKTDSWTWFISLSHYDKHTQRVIKKSRVHVSCCIADIIIGYTSSMYSHTQAFCRSTHWSPPASTDPGWKYVCPYELYCRDNEPCRWRHHTGGVLSDENVAQRKRMLGPNPYSEPLGWVSPGKNDTWRKAGEPTENKLLAHATAEVA